MAEQSSESPKSQDEAPPTALPAAPPGGSTETKPAPAKPKTRPMPLWKVLLHNDDENAFEHVIKTIIVLTHLSEAEARQRTLEAHEKGLALVLTTHQERAELYQQQFTSCKLTVTIEPE